MKWYQHKSDFHASLKGRAIIRQYGMEGVGFWWLCCEIVAKDGEQYRIKARKNWKITLSEISKFSQEKTNEVLDFLAENNSIDKKAFTRGDLYIPKMADYSDDYTKRVRRVSEPTSDNVRQDKITLDNTRIDKNTFSAEQVVAVQNPIHELTDYFYELRGEGYYEDHKDEYSRHCKDAKDLLVLCDGKLSLAREKMEKVSQWANLNDFEEWFISTVNKKFLEIDSLKV